MIVRLSVVDQSPIPAGYTAAQALANTIDLAQRCEAFGYHRYWLAEHHSSNALAGSAPEILIGRVAASTSHIRVGSGGVMLTHYSSYKVAEQFAMLEALFPGRIDLGLGRAPGSDQVTAAALAKGPGALSAEHYPAQVIELANYLQDRPDQSGPFRGVRATPTNGIPPQLWILASSSGSASIAAHLGLPLVWAEFIAQHDGAPIVDAYRREFQPSELCPEPRVMLATTAIAADTEEHASYLATSVKRWRLLGLQGPIPEPTDADAPLTTNPLHVTPRPTKPLLSGTATHVRDELEQLAERYQTEDVFVITITHDHQARVRSYELLAQAFQLTNRSAA